MKRKFSNTGISLISLIITIIVIIILAAIVIFSGMDTPEKAQLSKVISDIDNVQTAVDQAYYGLYTEKAVAGEVWTPSQFYEAVATGEKNRDNLNGTGLIEIGENSLVDINLPKYEGRKWYIAVSDVSDTIKTGSAVLSPGFESQGKTYATLLDIQNGGSDGSGANGGSQGGEEDENAIVKVLQVGDYVKYEADSNNSYQLDPNLTGYTDTDILRPATNVSWRVWEIKDNAVVIMPTSRTNAFYLGGGASATGFVNSINIIEDVCKIYANEEKYGVSIENIRNLEIDDIESKTNYGFDTDKTNYINSIRNAKYGDVLTYYGNQNYYIETDGHTISKTPILAQNGVGYSVTQTFFGSISSISYRSINNTKWTNLTYENLLGDDYITLASTCTRDAGGSAGHCLFCINYYGLALNNLEIYLPYTLSYPAYGVFIKPLVTLRSSKLKISGGDGSEASPWTLEKK